MTGSNDLTSVIKDVCPQLEAAGIEPVKIGVPFRYYCAMMMMGMDVSDLFYY